jgi:hypothetical protein
LTPTAWQHVAHSGTHLAHSCHQPHSLTNRIPLNIPTERTLLKHPACPAVYSQSFLDSTALQGDHSQPVDAHKADQHHIHTAACTVQSIHTMLPTIATALLSCKGMCPCTHPTNNHTRQTLQQMQPQHPMRRQQPLHHNSLQSLPVPSQSTATHKPLQPHPTQAMLSSAVEVLEGFSTRP